MTMGFCLLASISVLAANMDQGKMEGMKHEKMHEGMDMSKSMIMLGEQTVKDVKAMAHLQDVKEEMAKMGMSGTHHLMLFFQDGGTGKAIKSGTVAVKIKSPSSEESAPLKLMGMEGHFGGEITLKEKGEYQFLVGTKLADGVKRQYQFTYVLK